MTAQVKKPGSRGGHGYYDERGVWQYGIRPFREGSPQRGDDMIRWGVSAYHHLGLEAPPDRRVDYAMKQVRAEWERQYPDWDFPDMPVQEGIERAHKGRKTGHDDLGYQTSEELRDHVDAIKALGYAVEDKTQHQPLSARLRTWSAVHENCSVLHNLLPGLSAFLAKYPLRIQVLKATEIGGNGTLAMYDVPTYRSPATVKISPKYNDSLAHEIGHYIDNVLSKHSYTFSSLQPDTPLHVLTEEVKAMPTYQRYARQLVERQQDYHNGNLEVFARLFEAWTLHKTNPSIDSFHYGEFVKDDLLRFDTHIQAVLKDAGLVKSLREWAAGSHLWKSVIQHPGSRGGQGYYDDRGEWVYGERPQPIFSAVQSPGHAPALAPDYDDDDPFGGYDPSADASNYAETTEADRVAYEQETQRELRGIKRHDDAEIRRFIMKRGIRRSDKDQNGKQYFNAEYNDYVPLWARNQSNGITLDQMRRELDEQYPHLGLDTLDDLLGFLEHFEDTRTKKSWHAGSHTAWDGDLATPVTCWAVGSHAH